MYTISNAAALIKTRQFEQAMQELKTFLQHQPDHEIATGMLASIYAEIDMPQKALELYARVLEINPGNILARFHLGLIHFGSGDFLQAIDTWKPALSDPDDFMIKYHAGLAYLKISELSTSIQLLTAARELMPEDHPIYEEVTRQLEAARKLN